MDIGQLSYVVLNDVDNFKETDLDFFNYKNINNNLIGKSVNVDHNSH